MKIIELQDAGLTLAAFQMPIAEGGHSERTEATSSRPEPSKPADVGKRNEKPQQKTRND